MALKIKMPELSSHFKRTSMIIGLIGGIIAVTLGLWQIINQVRASREIREKVSVYLSVGDRFVTQMQYDEAIDEYQKAIELERANIEAHRRIITTMREKLLYAAFVRSAVDIGLGGYGQSGTVSESEVNAALSRIYQLQAVNPSLKDDVGLLLDEALILKTYYRRSKRAIKVLEQAHKLSPENHKVLAELGLMKAFHSDTLQQKIEGLYLIRHAVELRPNHARYHFYLARSLSRAYGCVWESDPGDAEACAEAIREYHRAADLATTEDVWSKQIRYGSHGPRSSIAIFKAYARIDGGILTLNLNMPLDECIKELEYLKISKVWGFQSLGIEDNAQFLLATLCHATGNNEKAERLILELLERDYDRWYMRLPWVKLYEMILEESGQDAKTLSEIRLIIKQAEGASRAK